VLVAALLSVSGAKAERAAADIITVQGQDDVNVDRQAIQNAIDSAEKGDTIELVGTFQLDGQFILIQKSSLTIQGRAIDNDMDGAINEDWKDGLDNDDDGWTDEDDWDTVLRGLAYADGSPQQDSLHDPRMWNRAMIIQGIKGKASDITVRDLRFNTLHRGFLTLPEYYMPSLLCSETVYTGGTAEKVTLANNRFDNVVRGFQFLGNTEKFVASENVVSDLVPFLDGRQGHGGLVLGGEVSCVKDGQGVPFEVGSPRKGQIIANHFVDSDVGFPMIVWEAEEIDVSFNEMRFIRAYGMYMGGTGNSAFQNIVAGPIQRGIIVEGQRHMVTQNVIKGPIVGLEGAGDSGGSQFVGNVILGADFGIYLDQGASLYLLRDNEFSGSGAADIWLDSTTHDNLVFSQDPNVTVVDEGTDNKLLGKLAGGGI
jgi:hypothetical protein